MRREVDGFIYFHYSQLNSMEKCSYSLYILTFLKKLVFEYPFFMEWFNKLFTSNYNLQPNREIIICEKNFEIAGLAILKRDNEEEKICTLRVSRKYQKLGIGKRLMEYSFEWLQNDKPLITLHKSKQQEFNSLFRYYDFNLEQKNFGYYKIFSTELVYNGILPHKNILINKFEIFGLENIAKNFIESGAYDIRIPINRYFQSCWNVEKEMNHQFINV